MSNLAKRETSMNRIIINQLRKKGHIMQTKYFRLAILTTVISSLLIGLSFAQPPAERGPGPEKCKRFLDRIPDLTDKQAEQIKDLKTAHMKEVLPLRNLIHEKQAHLQSISTGENVDMKEVNTTIEEIGKLKVTMAKKRAAHRQKIRNILDEDQRVVFDSMPMKKNGHAGNGCRPDHHKRIIRPGNRF